MFSGPAGKQTSTVSCPSHTITLVTDSESSIRKGPRRPKHTGNPCKTRHLKKLQAAAHVRSELGFRHAASVGNGSDSEIRIRHDSPAGSRAAFG